MAYREEQFCFLVNIFYQTLYIITIQREFGIKFWVQESIKQIRNKRAS
jgi:hypothetical protein